MPHVPNSDGAPYIKQRRETRYLAIDGGDYRADSELRVQDGEAPVLAGYAAVFNSWSVSIAGLFREIIRPGAFTKTINENHRIKALWNHNADIVLGSRSGNTLLLREDDKGLFTKIQPPLTREAEIEAIRRRDVTQMSIGFRVIRDLWTEEEGKELQRELLEVELFDVSPVAFPAYQATSIDARSIMVERGVLINQPDADYSDFTATPDADSGDFTATPDAHLAAAITTEPDVHLAAAIHRSHQARRWELEIASMI